MSQESIFGHSSTRRSHDHHSLKSVLHRYLIDRLEEEETNLLEAGRPLLSRFIHDRVEDYIRVRQLALSRYEIDRLSEELLDELTGFGPLEILLSDASVTEILVNGPHRVFIERRGVLQKKRYALC